MTTHRTILITGASRGLGLALARALAGQGWQLILNARQAEALAVVKTELAASTPVITIAGDVSDPTHRQALVEAARVLGGLDAVINNASILGPSPQPNLLQYPLEVLEQVYRVNTLAPLAILQAVQSWLKPEARILNVTSDAGVEAYPGWGGYGSSKAALEQLSAVLAVENPGWRVYWVDPGDMRTQMHQEAFPGEDISDRPLPELSVPGFIALLEGDYPSGRYQARALNHPNHPAATTGIQELRVALTVENLDEAVKLYHEGLGLPVVESWESPGGRGVVLAASWATVELLDQDEAARVDQIEVGQRLAGPVRLALEVQNLAASTAAVSAAGADKLNGPVETPWGHLNQRLQTPEGLHLTLFQPLSADS